MLCRLSSQEVLNFGRAYVVRKAHAPRLQTRDRARQMIGCGACCEICLSAGPLHVAIAAVKAPFQLVS